MKAKEILKMNIEDNLRARQFLDGNVSKEILVWSQKPENQKIIEMVRLIRLKEEKK